MARATRCMSETVRTKSFRTLVSPGRTPDDGPVNPAERVLVYGATGHTGRFVVDELLRHGLTPVLAGRRAERLAAVAPRHAAFDRRVVGVDDPDLLRRAVAGVGVVVNCAGPFLDTAVPLARAAVQVGAHYLDVTAEQPVGSGALPRARLASPRRGRRRRPGHGLLRRARRPARHRRARRGSARGRGRGRDRPGPLVADRGHPSHRRPQHGDPPGDPRRRPRRAGQIRRPPVPGPTRRPSATSRWCSCRSPRSSRFTVISTSASSGPTSTPRHSTTSTTPRLRHRPRSTRMDARPSSSSSTSSYAEARTPDEPAPPAATSTPSPHRSSSKARSDSSTDATAAPVPPHRERHSMPVPCSTHWSETSTGSSCGEIGAHLGLRDESEDGAGSVLAWHT